MRPNDEPAMTLAGSFLLSEFRRKAGCVLPDLCYTETKETFCRYLQISKEMLEKSPGGDVCASC